MKISATYLRQHIYEIIDQIISTGEPVEIERFGRKIKLVPVPEPLKLDLSKLPKREDIIIGDPEDLVHIDWSTEWKP